MKDKVKTKEQLINELEELRKRITGLETSETEHKRTEQTLRESEERHRAQAEELKTVLEYAAVGLMLFRRDMSVKWVNHEMAAMFGLKPKEMIDSNWYELVPSMKERKRIYDRVMRGELLDFRDAKVIFPDGDRYFNIHYRPIRNSKGTVLGLLAAAYEISHRKLAEEASRRAEVAQRQLVAILEGTTDFIGFADPQGRILYINKAGREMVGVGKDEDVSTLSMHDVHPDWANKMLNDEGLPTATRDGIWTGETAFLHRDGHEIPTSMVLLAHKTPDGEIEFFSIISRDITERKLAEEASRRAEVAQKQLVAILEGTTDFVGFADPQGRILYINKAGREMVGVRKDEDVSTLSIHDIHPDWTNKMLNDEGLPTATRDGIWTGETAFLHRDGHEIPTSMVLLGHKTSDGEIEFFSTISRDITEPKRVEKALRDSEARYQDLYDNAPDMFASEEAATANILQCNKTLATNLGYTKEDIIGQPILFLYHPDCIVDVKKAFYTFVTTGEIRNAELQLKRKDGSKIEVSLNVSAVRNEQGDILYSRSVWRDISDRKQAEEKIRRLNEELEQRVIDRTVQLEAANKELESFSYSVSHDLRAPLRAINGFSCALLEDCADRLDAEAQRYLNLIAANAQNMGKLIDDLLAFSRLGRQQMEPSNINLGELARTVFDELKSYAPDRTLRFKIETLSSARGDLPMIHQVFTNLLSNAIKFTRPKESASIEIGSRVEHNHDVYYVKDNGVGFDMKYVDKLFRVFQRLQSVEEFEGTGVGLAIVRRIIHRHGGRVWAEGKVNEGATFYFTLPK